MYECYSILNYYSTISLIINKDKLIKYNQSSISIVQHTYKKIKYMCIFGILGACTYLKVTRLVRVCKPRV